MCGDAVVVVAELEREPKRGGAVDPTRRRSSVAMGINKALDEYPEELRGMLMMDGELDMSGV